MNYDEQHKRVERELAEKKALEQSQQQKFQERLENIIAMREAGKTLQEIGDAVGVTRQRVEQLLKPTGIEAPFRARREERRKAVAEWAENNPTMSCEGGGKLLGISTETVRHDLKTLDIKRDTFAIHSAAMVRAKLDGRVELTEELLRREYLENNLSTPEIARKYGYAGMSTVLRRLKLYNIRKDKAVVYRQISTKRSGTKLINGRFV